MEMPLLTLLRSLNETKTIPRDVVVIWDNAIK